MVPASDLAYLGIARRPGTPSWSGLLVRTIDRSLNGCFGPHRMRLRRQIDGWRSRKRRFSQGAFGQLDVCGFLVLGNFVQTITVCCDPVLKKMFLVLIGHGAFQ